MKKQDGRWERFDDYVIDFAVERQRAGERIALVTLVKIEGSSPRPLGAQMVVSETGDWAGYLSGGCIERAVLSEALSALRDGENRYVRYGHGSKYLDIQLPCGSAIELVFDVNTSEPELAAVDALVRKRQVATLRVPGKRDDLNAENLVRTYHPRRKLVVAGVGAGAVQLARLGLISGFETVFLSPDFDTRDAAEAEGIVSTAINGSTTVPDFRSDRRTAIAFMFHDHEWEKTLIPAALETEAFYIGAMGSRRAHRQRLDMLKDRGLEPSRLGRIRGPAGLFSGAKSAPDISLSILAEIVQIERAVNAQILTVDDLLPSGEYALGCRRGRPTRDGVGPLGGSIG